VTGEKGAGSRGEPLEPAAASGTKRRLLFFVNTDWYFSSHRLPVARAARDAGLRVSVATRVVSLGEALRREGFEIVPIRMSRALGNPVLEGRSLVEILRACRRIRPDLVHNVSLKCVLYGTLAARIAGVRGVINTLPGLGYVFRSRQWKARLLRPFVRLAFRALLHGRGTRVIVQNSDDLAFLRAGGLVAPESLVLIRGSGVDTSRFRPAPEPTGTITITMVSRMLWDKGVAELVEAAGALRASGLAVRVVLVGAPDPENPGSVPARQLEEWNRSDRIEWSGAREDIPRVWAESHIAVLPTYYGEGLPKSLLEAASCARAIVAADVPGCREIVRHGENGFLVPPRDARSLAQAIERLIVEPSLRERMGARGRVIVESEFSEEIVVARTLEVYRELLESGDRGR
jgi:glycosyltransferase involved in cell wall biosynthesis